MQVFLYSEVIWTIKLYLPIDYQCQSKPMRQLIILSTFVSPLSTCKDFHTDTIMPPTTNLVRVRPSVIKFVSACMDETFKKCSVATVLEFLTHN